MCTKIFIALLATAIAMPSCEFMVASKTEKANFTLNGHWNLDSITPGKDTSSLFPALMLFAATDSMNKLNMQLHFKDDTIVAIMPGEHSDTILIKNDTTNKSIAVRDEPAEIFYYRPISSSIMQIIYSDSTILHLSRNK
ncbi:hypothetical protein [Aridibaculum aurantiacum]|uniref:hypothetical protein n=1 Tax=Aridibaculum aurantiacum TaxID=2810307 RepID=UPI001A973239|nr:hypothetical protein [Aridibaculum aurantiacum]